MSYTNNESRKKGRDQQLSTTHTDKKDSQTAMIDLKGDNLVIAKKQAADLGLSLTAWVRMLVFQKITEYRDTHKAKQEKCLTSLVFLEFVIERNF